MTAIEQLQAAIDERKQQLGALEYALAILQAPPGTIPVPVAECRVVEPPAKKSPPPVAQLRPEGSKAPRVTGKQTERLHQIARLLAERGPTAFKTIMEKTGINVTSLGDYLKESEHFTKVEPSNRLSPWTLTESGRRLASSAGPG